ncbi:hypothetical protein Hanom_Chr16g01482761 [Helianthus anomalus]
MDAYRKICFPAVMARIREIMFFLLFVFFLNGATRGKAQLSTLPQKGAAFSPQKCQFRRQGLARSIILFQSFVYLG